MKSNEAWLQAAWKEKGKAAPKAFEDELEDALDAPELSWVERQYLDMFNLAQSCRPASFSGVMPIPYLVVAEVLERNGYYGSDAKNALYVISAMDSVVIEKFAEA